MFSLCTSYDVALATKIYNDCLAGCSGKTDWIYITCLSSCQDILKMATGNQL